MRQLLNNLHPPSPPTAQENRQLLNVLQSSFKRQLDARHPNPLATTQNDHSIPMHRDSVSAHATATHMRSLLAHPIIGSLTGLHDRNDAVAKFDRLIAESPVDLSKLAGLIQWYSRATKAEGTTASEDTLGTKLNAWLLSADDTIRSEFFLNEGTLIAALRMLYAESNESVLWKWLGTVYERESLDTTLQSKQWLRVEDWLVSTLIRMAISRGYINEAAQQYVQACQYKLDSGRVSSSRDTTSMTISGNRLASSIIFLRHNHGITPILFSESLRFLPSASTNPETSYIFCSIYSPTAPSADALYSNLRHQSDMLLVRQRKASPTSRKTILTALLDASRLSLDQGKRTQAAFLLDFAIDNYPDHIPARQKSEVEPQLQLSFDFLRQVALT